ncbi:hypothetical protein QQ045_024108 [Rhodiola kirilowii]
MPDSASSTCTAIVVAAPTVQIVTKASSDQLLSKFADSDDGPKTKIKDRRKIRNGRRRESGDFIEKKSLLPPAFEARRRSSSSTLIRKVGIGRGRASKTKSIILKTWTRTVQGASRMFMEKHYNRHKRLISDASLSTATT